MAAVAGDDGIRRYGATALRILAVAAAYYAGARIGLSEELVRGQITPLWPPTGIALACLLLLGLRTWPGIALGALLVNAPIGPTAPAVAAIAVGNTAAPVCAYLLLRRRGFRTELDRLRDALALIFLGALAGMLISSTVGTCALALEGAVRPGDFWATWSVWWTGDAMGILVITPLLLMLPRARPPSEVRPYRWAEAGLLMLGTAAVALLATHVVISVLFLVFPFLIWAALRFQLAGAVPCSLIVSVIAIQATAAGVGPFAGQTLLTRMINLQAFNGSVALTALLLSAIITERIRTRREIEQICTQLAEAVVRLAPDEASLRQWPPPGHGDEPPDRR